MNEKTIYQQTRTKGVLGRVLLHRSDNLKRPKGQNFRTTSQESTKIYFVYISTASCHFLTAVEP